MQHLITRIVAIIVTVSFTSLIVTLPRAGMAETFGYGKPTADAAAVLKLSASGGFFASSDPDSTEFQFPEEDNHLVRDITVFVIVSAFVAFFLIKVFLEGDTDEENGGDDGGKPPPGGNQG